MEIPRSSTGQTRWWWNMTRERTCVIEKFSFLPVSDDFFPGQPVFLYPPILGETSFYNEKTGSYDPVDIRKQDFSGRAGRLYRCRRKDHGPLHSRKQCGNRSEPDTSLLMVTGGKADVEDTGTLKKNSEILRLSPGLMEVEEGRSMALSDRTEPERPRRSALSGLLKADEGTVMIGGKDAFYSGQVKNEFGYVPDEFGLYDNLKVWEYMDFSPPCYGLSGLVARERCTKLLEQVKLAGKEEFFVDSLSRGMKQNSAWRGP